MVTHPSGTLTTAASSGASRPTRISGPRFCFGRRAMTRLSTVAPTLAPQPPQRMGTARIAASASAPAAAAAGGGATSFCFMNSSLLYLSIHARSILSFIVQHQPPSSAKPPLDSTAYLFPVVMSPMKVFCGAKGLSASPSATRRRFSASGMPWRTAKTPALGRGCSRTFAQSPAANTPGWEVLSRVGCTATKPSPSVARPLAPSHSAARACVHHTQASWSMRSPWPSPSARSTMAPLSTPATSACSRSSKPSRSPAMRRKMARTLAGCVGSASPRVTQRTRTSARPAACSVSAWCMLSASSMPPAPAPTTVSSNRLPLPAASSASALMASQRAQNPSMGLTAVECAPAPGTLPKAGVMPTSMESAS
mmetsp:Transcript_3695/g.14947  ORF Transcript_3695/g.14947 Transcript_3695/m.14947 type:complete len:366 (+) Transcript_3695:975-2072(+)